MSQFSFNNFEERLNLLGEDLSGFVGRVMPDTTKKNGFQPSFDVLLNDEVMIFQVDLPGMNRDEVKLTLRDRILTISGERHSDTPNGSEVLKSERTFGRFSRSFTVPEGVKSSDIKAAFSKGILKITVAIADLKQPSVEIDIE